MEEAKKLYAPQEKRKRPQTEFEDAVRFAPQSLKTRFPETKLSRVGLSGSHIQQRRRFADALLEDAQTIDPAIKDRLYRTLSFADETGNIYVPDAEDVALLERSLPAEYRRVALASVSDGLNDIVSKRNLRKLEERGETAKAEELRTRAFQAQQYIDQSRHLFETHADIDDLHEIDRLFKKAAAGDAQAQKFVQEVMDYYKMPTPELAKAALWADAAQRNPELVAKDYSDEFSKRIRQGLYETGEFNQYPRPIRGAYAQEFVEFTYGLRKVDDLSDEMKDFVRKHNLVDDAGFYINHKRTVQPEHLSTKCPYVPQPKRRKRKPSPTTTTEESAVAVGQMGATVSQFLGSQGDQAEALGGLLRTAYSEDELEQVRQAMRQMGYDIPPDATKEEMFRALGNPPVYEPTVVPEGMTPMSVPAGEMPPLDPAAEAMLRQGVPDPTAGGRLAEAPPPAGEVPPPPTSGLPPTDGDFIPEPNLLSVSGAPEEVAQAMGAIVSHSAFGFKSSADRDIAQLLYYSTLRSDLTPDSVMDTLTGMGSGKSQYAFPLNVATADKLNKRSRFFEAVENDGVWKFQLREGAEAALETEVDRLRRDNPALLLYDDEVVKGLLMLMDLGDAFLADAPAAHAHYQQYLLNRLLLYPAFTDFEAVLTPLAAQFGSGSIDDLLQKIDQEWVKETKRMLYDIMRQQRVQDAILAVLNRQGMLMLGDAVLTADEWDALNRHEKMMLVQEIATNREKLRQLTQNFLGNEKEMMRFFGTHNEFGRPDITMEQPEIYYQNPVNVAALLKFAKERGVNPSLLITGAKLLYDHLRLWEALWQRLPSYGIDMSGKVITPEGLGGNFIKAFYRSVADKLTNAGYGDAADALYAIIENHDVLGWDILQRLLNNEFPPELEQMFGKAVDNLGQVLVLQDEFYHRAVNKNFAELFVPIFAALGRQVREVVDPLTGEVRKTPPIYPLVSLTPHAGAAQSLGAVVQQTYGMSKREFYKRIMPVFPEEIQKVYYTYKAIGKEDYFDLYVPQILADIIRGEDIRKIKTLWDFLNDLYKMNLVVFSPKTQMRNFFTNLLLISRGADASLPAVLREYREAFLAANENSRLYRDLKTIEGAFSGKALFVAEDEALLFGLSRWQRKMASISAHKLAGAAIRLQSKVEGMGKFAIVRLLLKRKYGKDWEKLYTQADLYDALRIVNEWMVDYRFVPPAIDYLRRVLGFFPFITFLYTISSTFIRNPDKLTQEIFRTAKMMWYFDRLIELPAENEAVSKEEEELLPPYMRNNPLLITWKDNKTNTIQAIDLTFWLPLGVFEGLTTSAVAAYKAYQAALEGYGGVPPQSPLQALIGAGAVGILQYGEWLFQQAGSILRPIVEVAANRSLMTDVPIYEAVDPPAVKVEKVLRHLLTQIPMIRDTITAINPKFFTRGKAYAEPEGMLEWWLANFLSMRKLRVDALAEQKYQQFRNRVMQYKGLISRVSRDPHMSQEQKERFIKQYLQALEKTIAEYETEISHFILQYLPEDGKEVFTDPEWYETIEEVLDEYEPITDY